MQTKGTESFLATVLPALLTAIFGSFAAKAEDFSDAPVLWEISIQSTVDWPPMAAPAPKESKTSKRPGGAKDKKRSAEPSAPVLITTRTLQASLTGQLLGIEGDSVQFAPALVGGDPIALPLKEIRSVRKASPLQRDTKGSGSGIAERSGEETGETSTEELSAADATKAGQRLITFRAGSSVPGRLLHVTDRGLVLAFGDTGELTVPLPEILSITPLQSDGKGFGQLPSPDGRHVARLTTGEVITGNIAPIKGDQDRLTISSPILSGEFPLALIESLLFPIDPDSSEAETPTADEGTGRVVVVTFAGGASLTSPQISLDDGTLELEIWQGTPFRIPLKSAESIIFLDKGGLRPNGPILLWGKHTDQGDEFEKLQTALEGSVRGRELIVMAGDEDSADFSAALRRSSAFIWGEWENFDQEAFAAELSGEKGQPLDEQLRDFVQTGGIAIFTGLSGGMSEHFAKLGLGEMQSDGSIGDGSDLELTGVGESLAPFMDGGIKATNSTMMYSAPEGGDWSPLLTQPEKPEYAAIMGRRIGSGWVFLMGMDFYETDENITRLLVELLQFRR